MFTSLTLSQHPWLPNMLLYLDISKQVTIASNLLTSMKNPNTANPSDLSAAVLKLSYLVL